MAFDESQNSDDMYDDDVIDYDDFFELADDYYKEAARLAGTSNSARITRGPSEPDIHVIAKPDAGDIVMEQRQSRREAQHQAQSIAQQVRPEDAPGHLLYGFIPMVDGFPVYPENSRAAEVRPTTNNRLQAAQARHAARREDRQRSMVINPADFADQTNASDS